MESVISPQFIANDVLTKLFNNTLEPTIDNIKYLWNLTSSFNYGLSELTNEQIDSWISLLSYTRKFTLQSKIEIEPFFFPSIIEISFISTQVEQICAARQKKIPDLLKIVEGISEETIDVPSKIIDFPIVPTIQCCGIVEDIIESFNMFKAIHNFRLPSFNSIIHYSILISLIYCYQLQQPSLNSYEEFKKRTKYIFEFQNDFICDINSMPTMREPFTFILIRSIFEDLNNIRIKRPIPKSTAFSEIVNAIETSTEKLDQTKYYGTLIYVESKQVPFSIKFCNSDYASLLFLMLLDSDFESKILYEKDKVFHFTPNFLMAVKFSKDIDFDPIIKTQMNSLFNVTNYVIEKVEPTPIEIITNKGNVFTLSERLQALGSLSVEKLREDDFPTVFSFWCSSVSHHISELKSVAITSEHLSGLAGICRVAVTFSKKEKFEGIDSILNGSSEKVDSEMPTTFPSVAYSTPSSVLSQIDEFNVDCHDLNDVLRYLLLISFIACKQKPIEAIEKMNEDFNTENVKNPLLFIALRYLYEKTFNTTVDRKTTNDNIFNEVLQKDSIVDALNLLVFNQGTNKVELTKDLFEKRDLYFALMVSNGLVNPDPMNLCDKLCLNGFQLASYVIGKCQTDLENLVTRAYYDDEKAAIELLKHKECLPLLTDNKDCSCHLLLKIFLSDEQPLFETEEDLEDPVEISAKLFVCRNKKPPETEILIQILKKCYYYLFNEPFFFAEKDIHLYFCGVMKDKNITVYQKEEEFFNEVNKFDEKSTLNFTNTVLYYTILYLKDQQHPELIHYYSDLWSHGLVSPKIKDIIPAKEEYRSIYWFLSTCIIPYDRSYYLSYILNDIKDIYIRPLYQYLLLCRDVECLLIMLQNSCCEKAVDKIGLPYLHQSLDLFFATNSSVVMLCINKITKILMPTDSSFLIGYICSHIIDHTEKSMTIFNNFKIEEKDAIEFISMLPNLSQNNVQITKEMIPFLEAIVHPLSRSYLHSKTKEEKQIDATHLKWTEDENNTDDNENNNSGFIDIWKERQYFECEGKNNNIPHHAFVCLSCDNPDSYICTACAATCHKNHHVSYVKKVRFNCACKNSNKCCFCNTQRANEKDEKENENNENKKAHASSFKLIDLLISLSKIKEEKDEKDENEEDKKPSLLNKLVVSRLKKPLLSCFTRNYELNSIAPRICFTEKKPDFVNVENVNGQYNGRNQQFYKKRCSYVPLNLSTYSNNHFIIAIGKTLYSFDEETYEIHQTLQLNEELLSVKQAKSTKDCLILTSLKSVVVVNANNFTKIATISPKNLNENNLIIQAEMPMMNKVAIVTRSSVQLYELNKADPIECYTVSNDFITSSVFVTYQDLPFGIFALNNGQIALQVLGQRDASESGSSRFIHFSSLPSRYVSIFISYSDELDLFFIAAPGTSLQYTSLENVFKYDPNPTYQLRSESGIRSEIYFYSTYPNVPSLLLFINPVSNSLFSIEFTDNGLEASMIDSLKGKSSLMIFDIKMNLYSLIRTSNDLFGISTKGSLLSLVADNETEQNVTLDEYQAPPTFFTLTELATHDNSEIIGTDPTQDYNTLYNDSVAFFHVSVNPKVMTIVLKDSSYSIVGFILSFSGQGSNHRPSHITVHERNYNCLRDYNVIVSLKQNEIMPGKSLKIDFANTAASDIAMQGIKIFIIKTDKIQPFLQTKMVNNIDLSTESNSDILKNDLLDFVDIISEPKESVIENLFFKITMAINYSNNNKNEIDLVDQNIDLLMKLITLVYSNDRFSNYAKSALIRVVKEAGENEKLKLLKIWSQVIRKLLVEKEIGDTLWQSMWRDYLLFPEEIKETLKDVIWESKPKIGTAESIISAFTFV